MGCQYYEPAKDGADSFTVAMPILSVGRGVLSEVGSRAEGLNLKRVAIFTDPYLANGPLVGIAQQSLVKCGIDCEIFSEIRVEPDDESVVRGAQFLAQGAFDGVVSVGGGSVIDTAKAAMVVLTNGGNIIEYFAAPIGCSRAISRPLLPHIACPTTSGTGSECTSISVLRVNELNTKFVIASPRMLPTIALVDPQCCDSLPANVVASTGFDLCCHALECFTAKTYCQHQKVPDTGARQYIQGTNPFSELAAREALTIVGRYLVRGVNDTEDTQARDQLMWGATLAGIAFGNSGTHLPHAMSYGVTHLMRDIVTEGYSVTSPFIPHGISVIVNAPAIFNYTSQATPERHLEGALLLGVQADKQDHEAAGEILSGRLIDLMKATHMPNGLSAIGFQDQHITPLAQSSIRQGRAIANAPRESSLVDLENMYRAALSYW